jgi:hypothetical protein
MSVIALDSAAVIGRPFARLSFSCEETIWRPGQAKVLAQRAPFVVLSENTSSLHLRHHLVHEIRQPAGDIGKHHIESVARRHQAVWMPTGRIKAPR